jgi:hypothetical protein
VVYPISCWFWVKCFVDFADNWRIMHEYVGLPY